MIIVIADDITGAAEIAGISLRKNIDTVLTTDLDSPLPKAEAVVIATDIRSGNEADAEETIVRISKNIGSIGMRNGLNRNLIFKKTDSVMRGHVVKELRTLMERMGFKASLLIAQNPSKGRVLWDGRYLINNVPICDTDFKNDPEFPAKSSSVVEILGGDVVSLRIQDSIRTDNNIYVADAENQEELSLQLKKANSDVLLAGGADMFNTILDEIYLKPDMEKGCLGYGNGAFEGGKDICNKNEKAVSKLKEAPEHALFICGSTQSKALTEEKYIRDINAAEAVMPSEVYHGGDETAWIESLKDLYRERKALVMRIGQAENGGKDYAVRLRKTMAKATKELVLTATPDLIVIEGGATAYSIITELDWKWLKLKNEYAPGIVSMTHESTEIILKPGSYPWGNLFSRQ